MNVALAIPARDRRRDLSAAVQELRELAARLERVSVAEAEPTMLRRAEPTSPEAGPALARALYTARSERAALLPGISFGEPSWDMLLNLYVAASRGRELLVSELYSASRAPTSTALRHLKRLRDKKYVELEAHATDARKRLVKLTPQGLARMDGLLAAIAALFESARVAAPQHA
jgi:DNA-binding MarR family transcriptional regulator